MERKYRKKPMQHERSTSLGTRLNSDFSDGEKRYFYNTVGKGYCCLTSNVFPTKIQPDLREETFQPESGKIAVEGTFYVLR